MKYKSTWENNKNKIIEDNYFVCILLVKQKN